jgi:hypothetical protein
MLLSLVGDGSLDMRLCPFDLIISIKKFCLRFQALQEATEWERSNNKMAASAKDWKLRQQAAEAQLKELELKRKEELLIPGDAIASTIQAEPITTT